MATKIDTKTAREALNPGREPYWHKLPPACTSAIAVRP